MKENFKYFAKMRRSVKEDAQIKIRYHWFKYKRQKKTQQIYSDTKIIQSNSSLIVYCD